MNYDIEEFIDELEQLIKDDLNTKIAAIDSEKADGITTAPIPDAAISYTLLENVITNYKASMLIRLMSVATESALSANADTWTIELAVIIPDTYDINTPKRLFRYQRALVEIVQEKFSFTRTKAKVEVAGLAPVDFRIQSSDDNHKAIGIEIRTTIFN